MQSDKTGADRTVKAAIKTLNKIIDEAQRRADRYIRLFHRARAEQIKQHWFDLAALNDQQAADASRKLREVLGEKRSARV
ncbi:hypothetical protein [Hyphomicrobium sp.]|uniref:hypothetical protein n=1 Tax=Hyphomicrobium sp. TaxID=82 RepID=UPI002C23DC3D|nr:hypothetical protein [Hyphomicrobium sp.]HRN87449.1 hypothetical protein [Hyphomicrobium sp.]HRQ26173.1 hypothetical protein [Hyphomicrobium sp.]